MNQIASEEKILEYFRDPQKGLGIDNTFKNLTKDGYQVTKKKISQVITKLKPESKKFVEQKQYFLKTVCTIHVYQADTFQLGTHHSKFVVFLNVETRIGYVYHVPNIKKMVMEEIFKIWYNEVPDNQKPTKIYTDNGNEFNNKTVKDFLEKHNVIPIYINKSQYKTSYATALVDRFIRTIKDKYDKLKKLQDDHSKPINVIDNLKKIVQGYNETKHSVLGKAPNEMTEEDVLMNIREKVAHNDDVMNKFDKRVENRQVGILTKKNVFDKGSKTIIGKTKHDIVGRDGYRYVLDNGEKYVPKSLGLI